MCLKDFALYLELENEKLYLKLFFKKVASLLIKKNVMKESQVMRIILNKTKQSKLNSFI